MAKESGDNLANEAEVMNTSSTDEAAKKSERRRAVEKPKKKSKNVLTCTVFSLDGNELTIEIEKNSPGEVLFSKVVENFDIVDKEYFGLRFMNARTSSKCWLNLHKSIKKQLGIGTLEFQFAVKFYEPEPSRHLDEYTRYLLYLQLRQDIVYGRLHCPTRTYILLGSFTAQAEFGDYEPVEHGHTYLDDYQLGPEEVENEPKFLQRVIDLHREHRGQSPAQSELNFLEVAKRTPRYGIDIHNVKDKKGVPIELGISDKGIILFKDGDAFDSYGWRIIDIVSYKRKRFRLKLFSSEKRKSPRFSSATKRDAKNLYKSAIEHHAFFRLTNPDPAKRRAEMFIIGSKFRYSDRTLYQIRSGPSIQEKSPGGKFARSPSKRAKSTKQRTVKRELKLEPEPTKEESDVQYEEIEIDESQPNDEAYSTEEWEIIEKILPDGSKRRYRRRIITTTTTTTTTNTYVIRKGTEEVGHMLEDKPITVSPVEERTEVVEEKPASPVEDDSHHHHHHEEIVTTTIVTKEIITQPEVKVEEPVRDEQISLNEVRHASKKPSAAVKPLMREDLESDQVTTTTTTKRVLVYDLDKEETAKIVSEEERERELKQRAIEEEEMRRREEERLRLEHEEFLRREKEEEERRIKEQEEFERRQLELQMEDEKRRQETASPQYEVVTLATGNEEFDKEFGILPDSFLIKTSPMPSKILAELEDEVDNKEIKEETTTDNLVVEDTRKAKTLDRKFVRRPPPERSSGYIRRSYGDELDYDYSPGQGARTMPRKMRKYVPLITKEELVRAYSSGGLHDDSVISNKQEEEEAEKSKIEYSLKATSGVEQGESGFVKSLIGRHETIKREKDVEIEERRRSRVYSSCEDVKGVVPTKSTTFANVEKPETRKTKVPPPVKTKPVVFHPNISGEAATPELQSSNSDASVPPPVPPKKHSTEKNIIPEETKQFHVPEIITTTVVYDDQGSPDGENCTGRIDNEAVERIWGKRNTKWRQSIKDETEILKKEQEYMKRKSSLSKKRSGSFEPRIEEELVINKLAPEIIFDKEHADFDVVKSENDNVLEDGAELQAIEIQNIVIPALPNTLNKSDDSDSNTKGLERTECAEVCETEQVIVVHADNNHFDWSAINMDDKICEVQEGDMSTAKDGDNIEEKHVTVENIDDDITTSKSVLDDIIQMVGESNGDGNLIREEETWISPSTNNREESEDEEVIVNDAMNDSNGKLANCNDEKCGASDDIEDAISDEEDLVSQAIDKNDRKNDGVASEIEVASSGIDKNDKENDGFADNQEVVSLAIDENNQENDGFSEIGIASSPIDKNDKEEDVTSDKLHITPSSGVEPIPNKDLVENEKTRCNEEAQLNDSLNGTNKEINGVSSIDSCSDKSTIIPSCEVETSPNKDMVDEGEARCNEDAIATNNPTEVTNKKLNGVNSIDIFSNQSPNLNSLKRKKFSTTEGEPNIKRQILSNDKQLERLKKEYDSTLADFLRYRSESIGEEPGIVPTKNISVVPAEPTEQASASPPPPDVITNSDTTTETTTIVNKSFHSDSFPSPPPDLVTQTIVTPHPTTATYVETKEMVSTKMLPPEVETHTIVVGGEGMSQEEIERLVKEGMVSSSETMTVTKTSVMTTQHRIEKTIVTEENAVVSSEAIEEH